MKSSYFKNIYNKKILKQYYTSMVFKILTYSDLAINPYLQKISESYNKSFVRTYCINYWGFCYCQKKITVFVKI